MPQHVTQLTEKTENRLFFVDEGFENHMRPDEPEKFYLYKSIAGLKVNQSAQNPILKNTCLMYLLPLKLGDIRYIVDETRLVVILNNFIIGSSFSHADNKTHGIVEREFALMLTHEIVSRIV